MADEQKSEGPTRASLAAEPNRPSLSSDWKGSGFGQHRRDLEAWDVELHEQRTPALAPPLSVSSKDRRLPNQPWPMRLGSTKQVIFDGDLVSVWLHRSDRPPQAREKKRNQLKSAPICLTRCTRKCAVQVIKLEAKATKARLNGLDSRRQSGSGR